MQWAFVLAVFAAVPCASALDTARTVINSQELGLALADHAVNTVTIKGKSQKAFCRTQRSFTSQQFLLVLTHVCRRILSDAPAASAGKVRLNKEAWVPGGTAIIKPGRHVILQSGMHAVLRLTCYWQQGPMQEFSRGSWGRACCISGLFHL